MRKCGPVIVLGTDVGVTLAVEDVADRLVLVNVLVGKHVYHFTIGLSSGNGRDRDFIAVSITRGVNNGL